MFGTEAWPDLDDKIPYNQAIAIAFAWAAMSLYTIISFSHVGFYLCIKKGTLCLKQHLPDMPKLCPGFDESMTAVKAQLNLQLMKYKKTTELASRYCWSPYSVSVRRWVEWGHTCALYSLASPWSSSLPWACCQCTLGKGIPSSPSASTVCLQSPGSMKVLCCCCCFSGHCTVTGNSTASSTTRIARSLQSLINVNLTLLTQKCKCF